MGPFSISNNEFPLANAISLKRNQIDLEFAIAVPCIIPSYFMETIDFVYDDYVMEIRNVYAVHCCCAWLRSFLKTADSDSSVRRTAFVVRYRLQAR